MLNTCCLDLRKFAVMRPAMRLLRITWPVLLVLTMDTTAGVFVSPAQAARSSAADTEQIEQGVKAYNQGDYATALRLWRPLAERGIARAQNNLAVLYRDGKGVRQNSKEAVRLFRAAAAQGHMTAQFNLARLYELGQIVRRNYAEAVQWYRKAAEQGHAMAQNNLGVQYARGQGVRRDYTEAARWYRKAAEQGNAMAQNNLGFLYKNGRGVSQNYNEAVRWFRKAAEQGNAGAQYNLGVAYEKGRGVEQNLAEAQRWYDLSAKSHPAGKKRDGAIATRRRVEAQLQAKSQKPSPSYRDLLNRAEDLIKGGNYKEALANADRAVKLAPKEGWGYLVRGIARYMLLNAQRGSEGLSFNYGYIKPRDVQERATLMRAHFDLTQYIKLVPAQANVIHLDRARTLAVRGMVHAQLGDFDKAITDLTEALNESEDQRYYQWRAFTKVYKKDYRGAVDDFTAMIGKLKKDLENPIGETVLDLAMAFYDRGRAHEKLGAKEATITDWNKAIELVKDKDDKKSRGFVERVKAKLSKVTEYEPNKQLSCNASSKEKSLDGYPTQLMVKILRDITFDKTGFPSPFQAPQQEPTVEAWETPQEDGLCAKVVFKVNGTNVRGEIEYAVYNLVADAKRRAEHSHSFISDERILSEFHGRIQSTTIKDVGANAHRAICWTSPPQKPRNKVHVECVALKLIKSGILTIVRGDFTPGENRQSAFSRLMGGEEGVAVSRFDDLLEVASSLLAKTLKKHSTELKAELKKGSKQPANRKKSSKAGKVIFGIVFLAGLGGIGYGSFRGIKYVVRRFRKS